ncbi:Belongs to the glycosyltransferase 2 [Dionaea muscipula]
MGSGEYAPLFETKNGRGRDIYRLFAASIFAGICTVWIYRATQLPWTSVEDGHGIRWGWMALLGFEIWFGLYWILSQALYWNPVYRFPFKDRLSDRYHEEDLPGVDILVCTADPMLEPPMLVLNTVLSVMAYDYPPEKLSVYLSDDGGSELTFYAMVEASQFSKYWLPYCKMYNIEPRSPHAYFSSTPKPSDPNHASAWNSVKNFYEEMESRIQASTKLGKIPEEVHAAHKGFSGWHSYSSCRDHDTILEILVDGRDPNAKDIEGRPLPTLVYLAREKRPQYFHNFKAGALNALVRVSSKISNGQIVLNVDSDMYSSNSQAVRDALCLLMDEKQSQQIAYVQFAQRFTNLTKNDLYAGSLRITMQVDFHGYDGFGGPVYIGSGCFHRRDILYGKKFSKDSGWGWTKRQNATEIQVSVGELEEKAKEVAGCTYELNSKWGKEMGFNYGFINEDVLTGLSIQCRGWKSVYLKPERGAFTGGCAMTLEQVLVQQKRWGEGLLELMLSKHCPFWFGRGRISLGLQICYSYHMFWAINGFPTLCYCTIPSLFLLKGIPLFPEISSPFFLGFGYVIISACGYSLAEYVWYQGTIQGWWNEQRIWLYKRTTSFIFATIDDILKLLGLSEMKFAITSKVVDADVAERREKEMMEFGGSSPAFIMLATIALLNLFSLAGVSYKVVAAADVGETITILLVVMEKLGLQIMLCVALVLINLPLYEAMFIRKDKGKMPASVTIKSAVFALLLCTCFISVDLAS